MASLNDQLDTLINVRNDIKAALIFQEQTVNNDIRTYATAVRNINSGGQEELYNKLYNIINMDGQVFNKLAKFLNINQLYISKGRNYRRNK